MSKNKNLHAAKKAKNDEFYTQMTDIENELRHYKEHFKGKTIFMNCDDPEESNFWKYFHLNFEFFGLKKIISTHYLENQKSYMLEYEGGNDVDTSVGIKTNLEGDGDFRSEEAINLLKQSDIVVTNPPFSLFREYVAQLIEYDKNFIIIGSKNAITYKEIFPLIKDNKMWLGVNTSKGTMKFAQPDTDELKSVASYWYTNLEHYKRNEEIILWKSYNEKDNPKYDNYDAIEVSRVKEIPEDYYDVMGVPITFMNKYNPEQFEILGMTKTPICYDNNQSAKRIKKYSDVKQYKNGKEQGSGNKVNDGSVIVLETPIKGKVYYKTDDIKGVLVSQYPRILIKRKDQK